MSENFKKCDQAIAGAIGSEGDWEFCSNLTENEANILQRKYDIVVEELDETERGHNYAFFAFQSEDEPLGSSGVLEGDPKSIALFWILLISGLGLLGYGIYNLVIVIQILVYGLTIPYFGLIVGISFIWPLILGLIFVAGGAICLYFARKNYPY